MTGAQKHPGDYADAQSVLDWEKSTRAELKTSNFAEVLAGRVNLHTVMRHLFRVLCDARARLLCTGTESAP